MNAKMEDQSMRTARIDQEVSNSKRAGTLMFRGKNEQLPVVRVSIELPIYRVRNGRTGVEQNDYIRREGKAKSYFSNGEEDQSVQDAQHQILLTMSKNQNGNIYKELKRATEQIEPLIITADGVIVNGNRRLAAMRDLYQKEPTTFPNFSHVDAIVLPATATLSDIEKIETSLQMAPETKLEYSWINRLLKIRYQVEELQLPRPEIEEMHRFSKPEDINKELQKLTLVDEYLAYIKAPGDYSKAEASGDQMFKELLSAYDGKPNAEYARLLAFPIIACGTELITDKKNGLAGRRAYDYREAFFSKDREKVLTLFAEEQGVSLTKKSQSDGRPDDTDDDDPLGGFSLKATDQFAALKPILQDSSTAKGTALALARIVDSLQQERKEEDAKATALKNVTEANRLLNNVDVTSSAVEKLQAVLAQLKSIAATVAQLQTQTESLLNQGEAG